MLADLEEEGQYELGADEPAEEQGDAAESDGEGRLAQQARGHQWLVARGGRAALLEGEEGEADRRGGHGQPGPQWPAVLLALVQRQHQQGAGGGDQGGAGQVDP